MGLLRVDEDYMFMSLNYGSPDTLWRKDFSDYKFLFLHFENDRIRMVFRCAQREKVSDNVQGDLLFKRCWDCKGPQRKMAPCN